MSVDNDIVNQSGNRPLADILRAGASRRNVLAGGLGAAAASFFAPSALASGIGAANTYRGRGSRLMEFTPVPVAEGSGPMPAVAAEYEYDTLIPWGTPLKPGEAEYSGDPNTRPTAAQQAEQFGIGHDGMWLFPVRDKQGKPSNRGGMLAINHEFGGNSHVLGKDAPESLEDVRLSQHAHGVCCIAIANWRGKWRAIGSKNNRRIHVNTPVAFSGPVAGSELLDTKAGNPTLGTVNNCSSGYTPWGTYVTCEENFNGYFGATNEKTTWVATEEQARYGFSDGGFGYGWENFDKRFDLSDPDYQNEENRFGWCVEIDPFDPTQTPVKRTAMGRFKHEGAEFVVGKDDRIIAYMGDDQRFDYMYKFVSADSYKAMLKRGVSPLDEGALYVARFDDDQTGEWLELTIDNPVLAARFSSQAEVLTYARIAGDLLGATPMDRPEWATVGNKEVVYIAMTNNSRREVADAANPLAPNADGHIIRFRDSAQHTGTNFAWEIFIIAESTHGTEDTFSDPDGLWADDDGRLFIETDGGQKDGLNNQLMVADVVSGELRRLLTGVTSDEITGFTITPDQKTAFVNTQHPGNGDPSLTNFPAEVDGVTIPRDCTIVLRRKDGRKVGL